MGQFGSWAVLKAEVLGTARKLRARARSAFRHGSMASSSSAPSHEAKLISMGFPPSRVRTALRTCGDNLEAALEWFCDHADDEQTPQQKACPRCTSFNELTAERCAVCDAMLKEDEPREEWTCSICDATEYTFLCECADKACLPCYTQWVKSCDEDGKDPTCMGCKKPLLDGAIRQILGDVEHAARCDRLLQRAQGFVQCPTPDCGMLYELDEEAQQRERFTTCIRCNKRVSFGGAAAAAERDNVLAQLAAQAAGSSSAEGKDKKVEISVCSSDEEEEAEKAAAEAEAALRRRPNYKTCPGCKNLIEKDPTTCHKFKCRCGYQFCWNCGKPAVDGVYQCKCTPSNHVAWDNVTNRAVPSGRGRKRPRTA